MLKNKIITSILIFSFLLITTCTNDNNLINSNNSDHLSKPHNTSDIYNTETSDFEKWIKAFSRFAGISSTTLAISYTQNPALMEYICFFAYLIGLEEMFFDNNDDESSTKYSQKELYEFRDLYLDTTFKGQSYIGAYYILSKFGIDNNLVNKHHKEHTHLLIRSIGAAKKLQNGASFEKIINNETADKIEFLVKVYREHPNHKDIDPVLDYLEADLNKYKNQPKDVIEADFRKIN